MQYFDAYVTLINPVLPAKEKKTQSKSCHLFLSSSSLIGLLLRSLFTLAQVLCLTSRIPQLSISTTLDSLGQITLADLLDLLRSVNDWQSSLEA